MKLTTLLILLILNSCKSQEPNNGFDNPSFNKDFNESKARIKQLDSYTLGNSGKPLKTYSAKYCDSIKSLPLYLEGTPTPSSQTPKSFGSAIKFKPDSDTKLTLPNEEDENDYNIEISDTQLVLGGKYIKGKYFADPQWLDNENLIKDKCGQWWERNTEFGKWETVNTNGWLVTMTLDTTFFSLDIYNEYCNEPISYKTYDFRLDLQNKIEYYRTVKVTYSKIQM